MELVQSFFLYYYHANRDKFSPILAHFGFRLGDLLLGARDGRSTLIDLTTSRRESGDVGCLLSDHFNGEYRPQYTDMQECIHTIALFKLTLGYTAGSISRRKGTQSRFKEMTKAIFLPEASDFIARNSAETVKITKDAGPIEQNSFVKGLQEQAIESKVCVTAGVHLPTNSESHVYTRP